MTFQPIDGGGGGGDDFDARDPDERALRAKLAAYQDEHRDLDTAIASLSDTATADQFTLLRMKKRKLWLRDAIAKLEDMLTPDIVA